MDVCVPVLKRLVSNIMTDEEIECISLSTIHEMKKGYLAAVVQLIVLRLVYLDCAGLPKCEVLGLSLLEFYRPLLNSLT